MRVSVFLRFMLAAIFFASPEKGRAYEGECSPDFARYANQIAHISIETNGVSASNTAVWVNHSTLITFADTFEQELNDSQWSNIIIRRSNLPFETNLSSFDKEERDKASIRVQGRKAGIMETRNGMGVVILKLDRSVAEADPVALLQREPLKLGTPVFSVLYAQDGYWPQLRYAGGHIFKPQGETYSEEGTLDPGMLWSEMITRPAPRRSRQVAEQESKGAPIFDCDGALVGIISGGLTQKTPLGVLPTAWGVPNIAGIKLSAMSSIILERMK